MDMSNESFAVITVTVELSDGGVRIYSKDVPGLHLASSDIGAALRDVAPAIKMLFKMNRGWDVEVKLGGHATTAGIEIPNPEVIASLGSATYLMQRAA